MGRSTGDVMGRANWNAQTNARTSEMPRLVPQGHRSPAVSLCHDLQMVVLSLFVCEKPVQEAWQIGACPESADSYASIFSNTMLLFGVYSHR